MSCTSNKPRFILCIIKPEIEQASNFDFSIFLFDCWVVVFYFDAFFLYQSNGDIKYG